MAMSQERRDPCDPVYDLSNRRRNGVSRSTYASDGHPDARLVPMTNFFTTVSSSSKRPAAFIARYQLSSASFMTVNGAP